MRRPPRRAWLALDGRELYEVQKAAGMLYKTCHQVSFGQDAPFCSSRGCVDWKM